MQTQMVSTTNGVYYMQLDQPLTGRWAGDVEIKLHEIAQNGCRQVVLNLKDVPFIDKRGLKTLISGLEALNNNAKNLQLVAPQTQPRLLFELTGYDQIFHITDQPLDFC